MSKPSVLSGAVLVASGSIGAGMFSLPIVASGMWTVWSLLSLLIVWAASLAATLVLARINCQFTPGASFSSMVDRLLGKHWNRINNLAIWFVLAILLYAYFSASGSVVEHTLSSFGVDNPLSPSVSGLAFGFVIAFMVWWGSHAVSLACSLMLIAMAISFGLSTGGLVEQIKTEVLWAMPAQGSHYIWYAMPYFVTAFACAGLVPSLVKHYRGHERSVNISLILGTFLTLAVYSLWLVTNFGTLSRAEFLPIIDAGGNMGDLAAGLQSKVANTNISAILTVFSNLAIVTSFLSIALGLFDYLADRFQFSNNALGRAKTALITFGPPALLSAVYPRGFILAIGYAGLVVLFSFFLVPLLMAIKQGWASAKMIWSLSIFVLVAGSSKVFALFDLLPVYR